MIKNARNNRSGLFLWLHDIRRGFDGIRALKNSFEAEALFGAFADAKAAFGAFGFIQNPALFSADHGNGVFGAILGAQAAEYAGFAAGELAGGLFLDSAADGQQFFPAAGDHVVIRGQLNGLGGAEILTHAAEGAGGKIEGVGDLIAALYGLGGAGDCAGGTNLHAHALTV